MKNNKEILSMNLKNLINKRNITRPKLAKDLGVSYSNVVNWTTAQAYPRIDKIDELADYFNVSKSQLVELHSSNQSNTDDLANPNKIYTFEGKRVSPETMKYVRRMLKGSGK